MALSVLGSQVWPCWVMCPFDSAYVISYWLSSGIKPHKIRQTRYSMSNVTQSLTWPWYNP